MASTEANGVSGGHEGEDLGEAVASLGGEAEQQYAEWYFSTLLTCTQETCSGDGPPYGYVYDFVLRPAGLWRLDLRTRTEAQVHYYPISAVATLSEGDCQFSTSLHSFQQLQEGRLKLLAAIATHRVALSGNPRLLAHLAPAMRLCKQRLEMEQQRRLQAEREDGQTVGTASLGSMDSAGSDVPFTRAQLKQMMVGPRSIHWARDEHNPECNQCKRPFTLTRRRHHCRLCGSVFCDVCTIRRVLGNRVCGLCFRSIQLGRPPVIVQLRQQSLGASSPIAEEVQLLHGGKMQEQAGGEIDGVGDILEIADIDALDPEVEGGLLRKKVDEQLQGFSNEIIGRVGEGNPVSVAEESDQSKMAFLISKVRGLEKRLHRLEGYRPRTRLAWQTVLLVLGCFLANASLIVWSVESLQHKNPWWHRSTLEGWALQAHAFASVWLEHIRVETEYLLARPDEWATWENLKPLVAVTTVVLLVIYAMSSRGRLLHRRIVVYGVGSRVVLGYLYLRKTKPWRKHYSEAEEDEVWERAHRKYSRLVRDTTIRLKGFWVKVGQYLSSRADVVPVTWLKELSVLQDSMPTSSLAEINSIVSSELGQDIGSLFLDFTEEPLGSASIAQVHRAVLMDGTQVVVKVQHKDIDVLMMQDMKNLEVILSWVAWFEPTFDFRMVVREWTSEAVKELDFNHEAKMMSEVHDNMQRAGLDVLVPTVVGNMVRRRVLVMGFMEGFKVTDTHMLDRLGVDRQALVRRICQAYANQVYVDGLFNADPHSGNILVHVDPKGHVRPVLLDFGLTKRLSNPIRLALSQMIVAASSRDFGGLLTSFDAMGLKLKREDPSEDMRVLRFYLRDTEPSAEARKTVAQFRAQQMAKREQLAPSQRNPVDAWPGELLFFFRVTALLRGLCSALDVRIPYLSILSPYASLALVDSYPPTQHARTILYRPLAPTPNGHRAADLQMKVRQLLIELGREGHYCGIQVAVCKNGVMLLDEAAGTMGPVDPRPVRPDTLFNCFSVTKAIAATAVHVLADRGLLEYDVPVARYWRNFAQHGKGQISVEQVLCHQAGLASAIPGTTPTSELCDWEGCLAKVEDAQPSGPPGHSSQYHILSFGFLVGGIVQAVCGRRINDFVRTEIALPLGIQDEFMIGRPQATDGGMPTERIATLCNGLGLDGNAPTDEDLQRLVALARNTAGEGGGGDTDTEAEKEGSKGAMDIMGLDPLMYNTKKVREACIPASNGHFSARALARFYGMLANGGVMDGNRMLRPQTIRAMSQVRGSEQTSQRMLELAQRLGLMDAGGAQEKLWGLGFRVLAFEGPDGIVRNTGIGHPGMGGSVAFCDLSTNTSVAITVNKLTLRHTAVTRLVHLLCNELGIGTCVSLA